MSKNLPKRLLKHVFPSEAGAKGSTEFLIYSRTESERNVRIGRLIFGLATVAASGLGIGFVTYGRTVHTDPAAVKQAEANLNQLNIQTPFPGDDQRFVDAANRIYDAQNPIDGNQVYLWLERGLIVSGMLAVGSAIYTLDQAAEVEHITDTLYKRFGMPE